MMYLGANDVWGCTSCTCYLLAILTRDNSPRKERQVELKRFVNFCLWFTNTEVDGNKFIMKK